MSDLEIRQKQFAEQHRITFEDYRKLVKNLSYTEVITCLEVLKAARHRSEFRHKMETQIRSWLSGAAAALKPLTPNQFKCLEPRYPVRYNLPN